MPKKKSNWPLVVLFAVFLILTAYMILTSLSIFKGAEATVSGTNPSIYCTRFVFEVEEGSINYTNKVLSFEIKNTYGDEITSIGVASDSADEKIRYVNFSNFYRRAERKVVLENFSIEKSFSVFSAGCQKINAKTFDVG